MSASSVEQFGRVVAPDPTRALRSCWSDAWPAATPAPCSRARPGTCPTRAGRAARAAPGACRSRRRPGPSCAGQAEIEQLAAACCADQARQRDGGAHVRQRIVRRLVHQAVGARQVLQLEARAAVLVRRPVDAFGPQRVGHAHHVEQVPAAAVVLPFARIRVDQVAPEQEARDLVVEADRVVADADGAGLAPNACFDASPRTGARARRAPGRSAA